MPIKKGDRVKVEYTGTFEDGTVFDSTEKLGEPLEFEIGDGQVIPGFEQAMLGMEVGETKRIRLEPADAYGEPDPKLQKEIPKKHFPTEEKLEEGMVLLNSLPDGPQLPAKVVEVTEESITLDLNHPLMGKVLLFNVTVLEVAA